MPLTLDEYKRNRRYLELVLEEFRRLAVRYPPLQHERFLSPLDISVWLGGFRCLTTRHITVGTLAHPGGRFWIGRFFGHNEGFNEFKRLASLPGFFPRIHWDSALTDWMEVVHELAEIFSSPLLTVSRKVWNWEIEDHFDRNEFRYESVQPP